MSGATPIVLLFSDHMWFAAYDGSVDSLIANHTWHLSCVQRYVIIIYPNGERKTVYVNQ